ncbi:MAG: DsbA family protein [Nitrosarchaeum sp.]|nr:DsbA family protein [Nitrosarchaeum sp.]
MESDDISEKKEDEIHVKKSSFNGLIIGLIAAVGVAAFFAGSYVSDLDSNQITQKDLSDAMAKLELKMLQNQLPSSQQKQPAKISADDDPVRGNDDAPITIIEFSDFQCPFCARFHIQTLPLLLENYIDAGKAKLVYRDFPIQGIHPNAIPAAAAAECADEQGKYWEYHDKLFENQNQWNQLETPDAVAVFGQYAKEIELNQEQFDVCLNTGKYIDEIRKDLDDGREYGVSGTPGFFIGNEELGFVELKGAQPFENFQKVLDLQLNALKK